MKHLWYISFFAMLLLLAASCGSDDEPAATYKYYMLIQSQVPLELSDNAEAEGAIASGSESVISTTVKRIQAVVGAYDPQQNSTDIEASLLWKCDSIYNDYASSHTQYSGQTVCFVQIVRSKMENGVSKESTILKTYQFRTLKDIEPDDPDAPASPTFSLDKPEGLEAVDLGLSVLWANCNLGASKPGDYGGYFGWGDPSGTLWDGSGIYMQAGAFMWETNHYGGINPPENIGGTNLDVVTQHWGNEWRTPSAAEALELSQNCEWKLRSQDGRNWYEVIGPNGNSIIIPLSGLYSITSHKTYSYLMDGPYNTNSSGWYWTSTICKYPGTSTTRGYGIHQGVATAWMFVCAAGRGDLTGLNIFNEHLRAFHMSIRPVRIKPEDNQPNQ